MTWRLKWYHFDDLACLAYGSRRELANRINSIATDESEPIYEVLCSKVEQPSPVETNGITISSSAQAARLEPRLIAEMRGVIAEVAKNDQKRKHYQWQKNEWPLDVEFADFGGHELRRDIIVTPNKIVMNGPSVVPRDAQPMQVLSAYSMDSKKELRVYSLLHVLDHLIKSKDKGDALAKNVVNKLVNEADKGIRRKAVLDYGNTILEDAEVRDRIRFESIQLPDSIDIVGFPNMGSNETCICLMADRSFRVDLGLQYVSLANNTHRDLEPEIEPVGCGAFS